MATVARRRSALCLIARCERRLVLRKFGEARFGRRQIIVDGCVIAVGSGIGLCVGLLRSVGCARFRGLFLEFGILCGRFVGVFPAGSVRVRLLGRNGLVAALAVQVLAVILGLHRRHGQRQAHREQTNPCHHGLTSRLCSAVCPEHKRGFAARVEGKPHHRPPLLEADRATLGWAFARHAAGWAPSLELRASI